MTTPREPSLHIIPVIPGDVRRVVPHVHSTGLTFIVTTTEGQTLALGWSSAAEALKDVAQIVSAIANNPVK